MFTTTSDRDEPIRFENMGYYEYTDYTEGFSYWHIGVEVFYIEGH